MKTLISMFTMKRTGSEFIDVVTGEQICSYKDRFGTEWLSAYPYYPFNFRIKTTKEK